MGNCILSDLKYFLDHPTICVFRFPFRYDIVSFEIYLRLSVAATANRGRKRKREKCKHFKVSRTERPFLKETNSIFRKGLSIS